MVPPSTHTESDYSYVVDALEAKGYTVTFSYRYPAASLAVGSAQDRERFVMVAIKGDAVDFTSDLGPVQGSCRQHLDETGRVEHHLWVRDATGRIVTDLNPPYVASAPSLPANERRNYTYGTMPPINRTTVLGHVLEFACLVKNDSVHSIDGLMSTFTPSCNDLVYDNRDDHVFGVRYCSTRELAHISGLHNPGVIRFLEFIPAADAHCLIGNTGTGETCFHIYDCIQKAMRKCVAWTNVCIRLHVDNIVSLKAREDDPQTTSNSIDDTLSVKFVDNVPPMRTDDVALDFDISEHSDTPSTITRPGARPIVPKQGTAAFSRCVEQCARLHENLGHSSKARISRFVSSGHNCYNLSPAHIQACMPECRICTVASRVHRKIHVFPNTNEMVDNFQGECWYLDDDDYGNRCGFTNARYARTFQDKATGFIFLCIVSLLSHLNCVIILRSLFSL